SNKVAKVLEDFSVSHVGTYNGNPLTVKVGAVVCKEILDAEAYKRTQRLNKKLLQGYNKLIAKHGLPWHTEEIGPIGTLHFTREPIKNYRDWLKTDQEMWKRWWFGMANEGVIATPYG